MRVPSGQFSIFISHKHDDHELAMTVRGALHRLSRRINCFVSGADITAGADWNHEIRTHLVDSHLLVLLFTRPSTTWDWCLYEAGLFTSLDLAQDRAIVSIYSPGPGTPRPLSDLQGIPAEPVALGRFLDELCTETDAIARRWRHGPLNARVPKAQLAAAVAEIVSAFPSSVAGPFTHHPCHRVVLDLRAAEVVDGAIPEDAVVVDGPDGTSEFTLSLFNIAQGARQRTWGELLHNADGGHAEWRRELDRRFAAALDEALFEPITAAMPSCGPYHRHRAYRPLLYEVVRAASGTSPSGREGRPIKVTVLFEPLAETADRASHGGVRGST